MCRPPKQRRSVKYMCQERKGDEKEFFCHDCSMNKNEAKFPLNQKPSSLLSSEADLSVEKEKLSSNDKQNLPSDEGNQKMSSNEQDRKLPSIEEQKLPSKKVKEPSTDKETAIEQQHAQLSTDTVNVVATDSETMNILLDREQDAINNLTNIERFIQQRQTTSIESLKLPNQAKVPDRCVDTITDLIVNAFDFEDGDGNIESKFETLSDAEAHFLRKFGYIQDDETDVMDFQLPAFLRNSARYRDFGHENNTNFHIKWKSIKYLFQNKWVDDLVVNFILKCYNTALANDVTEGTIPKIMFGDTYDVNMVVPDTDGPDTILSKGIDLGLEERPDLFESQFLYSMKRWYCFRPKGTLQTIMDYCHHTNMRLKKYGTIVNITNTHWIYLQYNPTDKSSTKGLGIPRVTTYDPLRGNSNVAQSIRRWFAKYFGLSVKQKLPGATLSNKDMNGLDMMCVEEFTYPKKCSADNFPAITEVGTMDGSITQLDDINCSIYALMKAYEDAVDMNFAKKLKNHKEQQDYVQKFRLCILSLIDDMFEEINGATYEACTKYLEMPTENVLQNGKKGVEHHKDYTKWTQIHHLFDMGHYKFNRNTTPLTIFNANSHEEIANLFFTTTTTTSSTSSRSYAKRQKKRNFASLDTDSDSVKKSSATKKPRNQKEKVDLRQNPSTYIKSLPQCSPWKDCRLSRLDLVHNVSNFSLTFDIARNKEEEKIAKYEHPTEIVKKIISHVHKRFKKKPWNGKSKREENVQAYMKDYYTYFLLDNKATMKDKDSSTDEEMNSNGLDKYEIKASMIIEPSIDLWTYKRKICMIHFFSTNFNTQNNRAIKSFLYNIFRLEAYRDLQVFVVSKNPFYEYVGVEERTDHNPTQKELIANRYPELLRSYGFRNEETLTFHDILPSQACVMQANASEIVKVCSGDYIYDSETRDYRILMVNDRDKTHVRYEGIKEGFKMYSHPFGWQKCTVVDFLSVSQSMRKMCKNEPLTDFMIKGGGYREQNSFDDSEIQHYERLQSMFTQEEVQKATKTTSTCMWLSACLLAYEFNQQEASKMLSMLMQEKKAYEYMYLFNHPPGNHCGKILANELNDHTIFQLQRVSSVRFVQDRLSYVLDPNTTGKYICQLRSNANTCRHVVGVDCDPPNRCIYDCIEKVKLPITLESFNRCCGEQQNGIKEIAYMARFTTQRCKKEKKKKKKKKKNQE